MNERIDTSDTKQDVVSGWVNEEKCGGRWMSVKDNYWMEAYGWMGGGVWGSKPEATSKDGCW